MNPRHPLIKELLRRVESEETDKTTSDLARVLFETAVLRSGYALGDSSDFAGRIERMLRLSLGVDLSAPVRLGRVMSRCTFRIIPPFYSPTHAASRSHPLTPSLPHPLTPSLPTQQLQ